jgi:hypothetical protein
MFGMATVTGKARERLSGLRKQPRNTALPSGEPREKESSGLGVRSWWADHLLKEALRRQESCTRSHSKPQQGQKEQLHFLFSNRCVHNSNSVLLSSGISTNILLTDMRFSLDLTSLSLWRDAMEGFHELIRKWAST